MSLNNLEVLARRLEDLTREYEEIVATHIPPTVREAIADQWTLRVEHPSLAAIDGYSREDQRKDATRIMPLDAALRLLAELEEETVSKVVKNPHALLWRTVRLVEGTVSAITETASLLWSAIMRFWQDIIASLLTHGFDEALLTFIDAVIAIGASMIYRVCASFVVAFAVPTFAALVRDATLQRDKSYKRILSLAFPQRAEPRYTRRKIAR